MEIINQNFNALSKQEESSLLITVSQNLARISGLKCIDLPKETFQVWNDQIKKDCIKYKLNIEKGFEKLLIDRAYGGLDYAIFLEGAMPNLKQEAEEQFIKCIENKEINDKSKSVIRGLGGNRWLSQMEIKDIPFFRKEFINSYISKE